MREITEDHQSDDLTNVEECDTLALALKMISMVLSDDHSVLANSVHRWWDGRGASGAASPAAAAGSVSSWNCYISHDSV